MSARRGFTLGEVIVTTVIIAALAAVVVPTIMSQLAKADPQRLGSDALAVRSGVEQFVNDVGQYPSNVNQLTARIVANNAGSLGAIYGQYSVAERDKWRGPYVTKDASAILKTGFDSTFNTLFNVDTLGTSGLSESTTTNPRFLTLCIALDSASAVKVDVMYDDGNLSTGVFRWTLGTVSASDTLKFILVPIQ